MTQAHITSKANLTITVLPPLSANERFMAFWDVWGDAVALMGAGAVGVFATFIVDQFKNKRKHN